MKKYLLLIPILFGMTASAAPLKLTALIPSAVNFIQPPASSLKNVHSLKIKDFQKLIGRKLTLKEKISFLLLKKKLRQIPDEKGKGQTAFVLGIIGLGLLIIGLFVPYVILGSLVSSIMAIVLGTIEKKKNPSDSKAKAGALLGWITLSLIAFLLLLAAIVLASWSFY